VVVWFAGWVWRRLGTTRSTFLLHACEPVPIRSDPGSAAGFPFRGRGPGAAAAGTAPPLSGRLNLLVDRGPSWPPVLPARLVRCGEPRSFSEATHIRRPGRFRFRPAGRSSAHAVDSRQVLFIRAGSAMCTWISRGYLSHVLF
jgi:hypothetical protein